MPLNDIPQLDNLDADLDDLGDTPTSLEVLEAILPYDGDLQAAAIGSRALAAGGESGGSQAVLTATKNLSSADLLDLDATPIQLLAAPSGREYYVVLAVVFHYRFVTTPYVGDFAPRVGYGTTLAEIDDESGAGTIFSLAGATYGLDASLGAGTDNLLQAAQDAYLITGFGYGAGIWDAWLADEIEGLPLLLGNFPNTPLADGDGTLTVRVIYSVIDGAPA